VIPRLAASDIVQSAGPYSVPAAGFTEGIAQAPAPVRILSVDDHPLLREGIAAIVNSEPGMPLAGTASSGREAIEKYRELQPDVTLMDLRLPNLSGIDALISASSPPTYCEQEASRRRAGGN